MASIVFHSPIDHNHPIANMVVVPKLLEEYFEVLKGKWDPKLMLNHYGCYQRISYPITHFCTRVYFKSRKSVNCNFILPKGRLMKTFQFADFNPSLRKKCRYLELFWSAFSRIRTKNYEYGHFSRCASHATGLFLYSLKTLED